MALALRQASTTGSLRIAVAERQAFNSAQTVFARTPERFDARVSALNLASQQLLARLGVWDAVQQMRCCPYRQMVVWDGEGTGSIHFRAADIAQSQLGTIAENSVVLTALVQRLNEASSTGEITQLRPFTIQSLQTVADRQLLLTSAEGQQCRTRLLIAADGSHSSIRRLAGFSTREWDYQHTALVTTVQTELPHQHTAWQRFMATGPLALLPLRRTKAEQPHYCSIVWSCVPARAEQLLALPERAFRAELGRSFEHRLGLIEWSDQRWQIPLRQRHATQYYRDNVVLIGDAAHTIHPLAGQGVNLGLLDVAVLADELAAGMTAGRQLDDPVVLARYQRKRRGHNLGMMWLMEGFKQLFARQPPAVQWLRNAGLDAVDKMDPIKQQLVRQAVGLPLENR